MSSFVNLMTDDVWSEADIVARTGWVPANASTTWEQKSISFVTPAGCLLVDVVLWGSTAAGSVWFDDASLVPG